MAETELKPLEMDPDQKPPRLKKQIDAFSIPYDIRRSYDEDSNEIQINVIFSDETEGRITMNFDKYFKAINSVPWNSPIFPKEPDLITMEDKLKDAAPYNVFFTPLRFSPETKEQLYTVSFRDLLCPSLGKLKSSFHITFMADICWILDQFASREVHKLPMTLLYGYTGFPWPTKTTMEAMYPNLDYHYIEVKENETALGCHHTKLSIFVYDDDSLRLVIGSVNLFRKDWELYNQELWVSPVCPKLPEGSSVMDGGSPTGFKFALIDYLLTYEKCNIASVQEMIARIEKADFSDIKVALLYSSPGVHYPRKNGSIIHYLGHLLTRDCTIPAPKEEHNSWRIIAQTASLGLIGPDPDVWLRSVFLKSLGSHKDLPYLPTLYSISKATFSLIYPSVRNVLEGYPESLGAFNYEKDVKNLQSWLLKMQYQWKADETKRTRAMSHSKIYCRISPCWQKMAYLFLTSANLSRSAWGKMPYSDCGIHVRSYEMGILFLPKYFGEEYFEVKDAPNQRKNKRLFPMMFDLPLTPYGPNDDSFCSEEFKEIFKALLASEGEESKDGENNLETNVPELTDTPPLADTSDSKKAPPVNKWDEAAAESRKSTEAKKKDMKFNERPKTDMFFPSFNKNV